MRVPTFSADRGFFSRFRYLESGYERARQAEARARVESKAAQVG
jgi:hypothetical protein